MIIQICLVTFPVSETDWDAAMRSMWFNVWCIMCIVITNMSRVGDSLGRRLCGLCGWMYNAYSDYKDMLGYMSRVGIVDHSV